MRHIFLTCIIFLISFHFSNAQEITEPLSVSDSLTMKPETQKKNFFKSVFDYFMGELDTIYVTPNKYELAFLSTYYNNNEYYDLHSTSPEKQTLRFTHKPQNKIGFYMGWQIFFLGWSFSVDKNRDHNGNKKTGSSFELSLYSAKFGIDIMHLKTGNNYRIHKAKGFGENIPPDRAIDFDGFDVNLSGVNLYYILNNKRFSYPAAYSQTNVQRRSAGSGIVGLSLSTHDLSFDYKKLPKEILIHLNPNMQFNRIKYTNLSLSMGYSYNWVFARNFLANISASPVLAYKLSKETTTGEDAKGFFNRFNVDLLVRAGVVYNNGKYYIGTSYLNRTYGFNQKNFALHNGFGTLQVYTGFNFYLKKKYRDTEHKKRSVLAN
ncbi:MAG: DUF4421 domain-containing protein [Bacteroidales bacterium]